MEIFSYYVPWDITLFFAGIGQLLESLGVIINVGFWGFLIITVIYLVIKIGGSLIS